MATPTAPIPDLDQPEWLVRRQPHPDAPGLDDLVDDVAVFRDRDIHRRPWLTGPDHRRDPLRFGGADRLWDDLLGRSVRRPLFRLVREGSTAAPSTVTRTARIGDRDLADLAAPNRVIAGYRSGSTVVCQGLHLTDPYLARFANNLALALDQPVQVNAYLTPASARGLDVHFDYHDVFVVQLAGTKRGRVWAPTEASREPIPGKHRTPLPSPDELGDPLHDRVLEPGDIAYVPRGHPHVAETTDRSSAHLTVGVLAITWHRVVRRAIDDEIAAGRLRAAIPLSTLDPDRPPIVGTPDTSSLPIDLTSVSVRRWVADEIWRRQAATRLRPIEPPAPALVDGPLTVTPGPLITLSRRGDRSVLFLGDRSLSMPDEAHSFLAAILRSGTRFVRDDLPGLDDGSAGVVLRRLLDEGVLAAAPAPAPEEVGR